MKHPDILKQLTLEQKAALLSGKDVWSTYAFPQAGVPSMVMSDGPHGLRRQVHPVPGPQGGGRRSRHPVYRRVGLHGPGGRGPEAPRRL